VNELLSHMNSLVTNQNDLSNLQALLQGSNQGLNLAANSAVSKYLDDYAKKLQKDNEERSSQLQKTLLEALTNGDQYKYLREAGYGFRTDGEGISAYRQIHSGEIAIDGSAMKETSYSPELEYQYIRIETKFNPGNLSVDMMDPNTTRFNAEMVLGLKGYIDNLQKNVEEMFAQFSNKTEEIKEEYAQNQEIESYQKKLYEASKENYVAAFQVLPGDLEKTFQQEMNGLKGYHEQGSKYNFNEGSFKEQSGDMKKVGKSMYDGANIEDTIFAGSRELKGSVSVKGIPVEISYGMQHLLVTSGFNISNLGFNFKLKGVGTNYVDNQLSGANQKYSIYSEDISARIEKQAKVNDEEKESKGFLFTILNGMNGGSGSMGQRFTQAVRSEAQSRITGAVAEATGLPASLVGALVGGSSMKDAVKAYVKDETTNAISKATGIPAWMISNQMEKMNKPKEQWYQSQTFQMVTTVVAVAAAPFTGGASLLVAMSIGAGIGAATGAASGGLKGALVGAVGGAAVKSFTGGAVTVGLSYSAENGFGASVGVGYGPATVSVGISERGGTTVDLGLKSGAFNGGLSYNSKTRSVSGNAGLTTEGGTGFALSYNEGDGFGASISKSLDSGVNGSLSWSQKGGVGGSIGYEAPGDKNQPKNSLANQMKGAGGSLSFNQRDGVSASVSASGGVNAGNWSQSGGFQANTNFLADQWKADFQSGKAQEDAAAQEASRAAQNKNNAEQGASNIAAAGISTQRREENILDHVLNKAGDALGDAWDGVKGAFGNNDASESLCFVSGTLVLTGTGLKAIDRVKIGDEVLAFNPETKDQSLKQVVRLFRNENTELLKINFGEGEEVRTTAGHRFFTENRGFVLACELSTKDILLDKAGERISIHSIVKETHKEKIPVFNFEVEDYHTYYVGETCILVHNDSVKMLQEKIAANGELNGPLVNKGIDKILDQVNSFDKSKSGNVEAALKDFAKANGLSESSPEYKKLKELSADISGSKSKGFNESRIEYYTQNKERIHTEALTGMYGDKIQSIDGTKAVLKNGEGVIITNGKYDLQLDNKTNLNFKREHENMIGMKVSDPDYNMRPSKQCFPTTNAVMADQAGVTPRDPSKQLVDDMIFTAKGKGILNENNHTNGGQELQDYPGNEKLNREYGLTQHMLNEGRGLSFDDKKAAIQAAIRNGNIVSAGGKFNVAGVEDHRNAIVGYDSKGWVVFDPYGNANTKGYNGNGMFAHYEYGKFNLGGNKAYYVTKD
ncbi:polymorphic toxin-type HINT domain-containing protein, partial [Leptospira santarosai]|uniref:polymorphic toxin-type HINT domain-containing protein n=1 Tax=Leptospira santarosai TaxID=28183 RepID=UPI0026E359EB